MSCCGSEASKEQPIKYNWPWLVYLTYWFTDKLFHSFYPKRSEKRHGQVMRLFQFCADRKHVQACSVYGHILLFRGMTPWDKKQGVDYLIYAAEQGEPKAAYQVAELIKQQAYGFTNDTQKLIHYWLVAAKADHLLAQQKLVMFFENDQHAVLGALSQSDKRLITHLMEG